MVTGLVTNNRLNVTREYIRQIRAMLNAWDKYKLKDAERVHLQQHYNRHRNPNKSNFSFKKILRGKIEFLGMVRGKADKTYIKYWNELVRLAPEYGEPIPWESVQDKSISPEIIPTIFTEGKTDWKYLKAAFRSLQAIGKYQNLDIKFDEHTGTRGDKPLLTLCREVSKVARASRLIFIFDRDNPSIVKQVEEEPGKYRDWGNNVFSFAIPTPRHRRTIPGVCIELYYRDEDLLRRSKDGRRIFLSTEFHEKSFRHLRDTNLNCSNRKFFDGPQPKIVDGYVFDSHNNNIALSKSDFADYILNREAGFDDIYVSEFSRIFDIIMEIGHGG